MITPEYIWFHPGVVSEVPRLFYAALLNALFKRRMPVIQRSVSADFFQARLAAMKLMIFFQSNPTTAMF